MLALRIVVAVLLAGAAAPASSSALGRPVIGCVAAAGATHRASVVIQHGDERVSAMCVPFVEDSLTAEQVLDRTPGLHWQGQAYGSFGQAVCSLDGEPQRYSTCLSSPSWTFWTASPGGSWGLSSWGISTSVLHDGDSIGFRFESGTAPPVSGVHPCVATDPVAAAAGPQRTPEAGAHAVPAPSSAAAGAGAPSGTALPVPAVTGQEQSHGALGDGGRTAASSSATPVAGTVNSPVTPRLVTARGGGPDARWLLVAVTGGCLGGLLMAQALRRRMT